MTGCICLINYWKVADNLAIRTSVINGIKHATNLCRPLAASNTQILLARPIETYLVKKHQKNRNKNASFFFSDYKLMQIGLLNKALKGHKNDNLRIEESVRCRSMKIMTTYKTWCWADILNIVEQCSDGLVQRWCYLASPVIGIMSWYNGCALAIAFIEIKSSTKQLVSGIR